MTRFVDDCRREWQRLNVPDDVANEMAAELEADLRDAEADGLSPEDVLGNGIFDPRSFATAWASERGVIPPPPAPARRSHRTLVAAVIAALALVALFAGIAILTGRQTTQVSIASAVTFRPAFRLVKPGGGAKVHRFFIAPVYQRPIPAGLVRSGIDVKPAGWILLALGLAGIAASALIWLRIPLRRRYTTA